MKHAAWSKAWRQRDAGNAPLPPSWGINVETLARHFEAGLEAAQAPFQRARGMPQTANAGVRGLLPVRALRWLPPQTPGIIAAPGPHQRLIPPFHPSSRNCIAMAASRTPEIREM